MLLRAPAGLPGGFVLISYFCTMRKKKTVLEKVDVLDYAAEGKALGDTTTLADPAVVAKLKDEYEEKEG